MKYFILTLSLTILTCINTIGYAQTQTQLTNLKKQHQSCLDKGVNMFSCSQQYYKQMDSLLNVAYNRIRKPMSQTEKLAFKNEQIKWLQKRDAFFVKVDKEAAAESGPGPIGRDFLMIAMDEKANFVRKRVEELIKRTKS
ncbi:MAG: hypothetical protein COW65_01255 [Cytophagales bacterium CG18_big_fil_WC_8_21_14_2_50_42_9]|nr:MAG: hypothetical protein COW65_01255 [Cytophagales bacterium CG18_big_fil_WC_8_21_14_2_50_42_9]